MYIGSFYTYAVHVVKARRLGSVKVSFSGVRGGRRPCIRNILYDIPIALTKYIQLANTTALARARGREVGWNFK